MGQFHKIWIEQCEAAQGIKEQHGVKKALGYLIGEKLMNFIQEADRAPEFAEELPKFIAGIKASFQPWEIKEYLDNVERGGRRVMCVLMSSMKPSAPQAPFQMIR